MTVTISLDFYSLFTDKIIKIISNKISLSSSEELVNQNRAYYNYRNYVINIKDKNKKRALEGVLELENIVKKYQLLDVNEDEKAILTMVLNSAVLVKEKIEIADNEFLKDNLDFAKIDELAKFDLIELKNILEKSNQ